MSWALFFRYANKLPVKKTAFVKYLMAVIARTELANKKISPRCNRIGAATWAAMSGFSSEQIKTMGRWLLTATRNIYEWNQYLARYPHKATDYTRLHTDTVPDCFCFISTTTHRQPLTPAVMIAPSKGHSGMTATTW